MVKLAVTIVAALVGTGAVGLIAPALLGYGLAAWQLVLVAFGFLLIGWRLLVSYRGRERRRLLDMRDSALW